MIGFILAAGFGTRLRPLTEHIPKALVPVAGIPLLQHNINNLHKNGMSIIGVNSHYLHEQMVAFQNRSSVPFELFYEEDKIRGTGGALCFAKDFLKTDSTFCIWNVDIISGIDLRALEASFSQSGHIASLIAVPVKKNGSVLTAGGRYLGVAAERSLYPDADEAQFIGVTLYRREFLDLLNEEDFSIIPVWKRAIAKGYTIGVTEIHEYWCDVGSPEAMARVHFDLLDQKVQLPMRNDLIIDFGRKICLQAGISQERFTSLQSYSWIDTDKPGYHSDYSDCLVIDNAVTGNKNAYHKEIVTPWGEIRFE